MLCTPEFKVEPTITFTNLFGSPRTIADDGAPIRELRETEFELILSLGLPTRLSWLDFTVEAIFLPFNADSTPELEFETNFVWLPAQRTGGWLSSHFDVVDKFSPAERPSDHRVTHKLNLELDASIAIFNWLKEGRWLRGVELEGSLDYVATGLPKAGDVINGSRFLDDASPWTLSVVFVLPIAPLSGSRPVSVRLGWVAPAAKPRMAGGDRNREGHSPVGTARSTAAQPRMKPHTRAGRPRTRDPLSLRRPAPLYWKPVSDRDTLEDLSQSAGSPFKLTVSR